MNSNSCSCQHNGQPTGQPPDRLAILAADIDALATEDRTRLPATVRAQRLMEWRRLLDRQEGHWHKELAAIDTLGAAGADQGTPAPSTASWLRSRLRMGASAATSAVRTARALFRGPLTKTGEALCAGSSRSPTPPR